MTTSSTRTRKIQSWLALVSGVMIGFGAAVVGLVLLLRVAPPRGSLSHSLALILCIAGTLWALSAIVLKEGKLHRCIYLGSVNALILAGLFGFIEVVGRVAHIDFTKKRREMAELARKDYPLWTREPDMPMPEVFYQHPGPFSWTGQPLHQLEVLRLGTDNFYIKEPTITINYDADGFRNPVDMKDWDAVVVGDSYTELGYLPDAQMSSSVAAMQAGLRVKNLGVCNTGLLAYSRYLKHFGGASSCKKVVFVMFEGNDVQDTEEEFLALQRYHLSGERDYRVLGAESSFVKAVAGAVKDARHKPKPQSYQNAWFAAGKNLLPITISVELPVDPKKMSGMQLTAMKQGIAACATQAKAMGMGASLLYVPVNNRVYHGLLRFEDSLPKEVRDWQPHELPKLVAEMCADEGIAFADATPVMRALAERGHYLHNPILDCHVNAEGARVMGEVIANLLTSTVKPAVVASP